MYRRLRTSFRKRVSFCGFWRASNSGGGGVDEKKVTETEQLTREDKVKIVVTKSTSLSLSSSTGGGSLKSWRNRSRFWRGRSANNNGGGGGSGGSGSGGRRRSNTNKLCCFCNSVESLQSPEEKYASYKGLRVVTLKKVSNFLALSFWKILGKFGGDNFLGEIFINDTDKIWIVV